ncbi:MAG TPA: hypothetical protein VGR21_06105 [Cryptosporangiaceae bacterium]|nr:hypothetical protein [Cryptosporangiaceae bacterium]
MAKRAPRPKPEPDPDRFRSLPARIKPEDRIETQDVDSVNRSGSPAGDPESEFMIRHIGF